MQLNTPSFSGVIVPHRTKTTESGAFYREKFIDENGKTHQKTKIFHKNDEKITLGYLGEFEVYTYPYLYDDKVFVGHFPTSTTIDINALRGIFGLMNRVRWFLSKGWIKQTKNRKGVKLLRERIVSSYNKGLTAISTPNNDVGAHNYNYVEKTARQVSLFPDPPLSVYKCPFCEAEIWFNHAIELIRHIKTERHNHDEKHKPKYNLEKCRVWVGKDTKGIWRVLHY